MANRPSVPEIITVNSETLQTQIRDLLPSQDGFGSELQASNVITPIIDLTAAAEGSGLPFDLQTALAFGSQTAYEVENTTTTVANSAGFYRIFGTFMIKSAGSAASGSIILSDGVTDKEIYGYDANAFAALNNATVTNYDFIVWLAAGESLIITSSATSVQFKGSVRQVADSLGVLQNPSGFPL